MLGKAFAQSDCYSLLGLVTLSCCDAQQAAGVPYKDAVSHEREAAAYREALTALAGREVQHRQLAAIRLELERLRLLLERVSKRERLKRESELQLWIHCHKHGHQAASGDIVCYTCS